LSSRRTPGTRATFFSHLWRFRFISSSSLFDPVSRLISFHSSGVVVCHQPLNRCVRQISGIFQAATCHLYTSRDFMLVLLFPSQTEWKGGPPTPPFTPPFFFQSTARNAQSFRSSSPQPFPQGDLSSVKERDLLAWPMAGFGTPPILNFVPSSVPDRRPNLFSSNCYGSLQPFIFLIY